MSAQATTPPFKLEGLRRDSRLRTVFENKETTFSAIVSIDLENLDLNKWEPYADKKILAEFASLVYSDHQTINNELSENERLRNWTLIATAYNDDTTNGYFGAAFINPSQHQVVVAHRGTQGFKPWITNIKGIWWNGYAGQMTSAMTFAKQIYRLLLEVGKMRFQLSFTGHSLGGWLAQVTTFALKYLRDDGDYFLENRDLSDGYHAHTVVFDCPGCEPMLSNLKMALSDRYRKNNFINIHNLDITTYLSAPNMVDTCNFHVGTIYRILIDCSQMSWSESKTVKYTLAVHSMDKILEEIKKDCPRIREVLDWPDQNEYQKFFEYGEKSNDFHVDKTNEKFVRELQRGEYPIRYKTQIEEKNCRHIRVFNEKELDLIKKWQILASSNTKLSSLEKFIEKHNLQEFNKILKEYELIYNQVIVSDKVDKLITCTKNLMRWFCKDVTDVIEKQGMETKYFKKTIFASKSKKYIRDLLSAFSSDTQYNDPLEVQDFVRSSSIIFHVLSPDTELEVFRTYNLLKNFPECEQRPRIFISWKELVILSPFVDYLFQADSELDEIFVIEIPDKVDDVRFLEEIIANVRKSKSRKLVLVAAEATGRLMMESDEIRVSDDVQETAIRFCNITTESQKSVLMCPAIDYNGEEIISLGELLDIRTEVLDDDLRERLNQLISPLWLRKFLSRKGEVVKLSNEDFSSNNVEAWYKDLGVDVPGNYLVDILLKDDEFFVRLLGKPVVFVITGIESGATSELIKRLQIRDEDINKVESAIEMKRIVISSDKDGLVAIKELSRQSPNKKMYLLRVMPNQILCLKMYDRDFYLRRNFLISHNFWAGKKAGILANMDDVLIFSNVQNRGELFKILNIEGREQLRRNIINTTLRDGTFTFEAEIKSHNKPVHLFEYNQESEQLFWLRSRGSLNNVRRYISAGKTIVDQVDASKRKWKAVIISEQPGMGKSTILTSLSLQMNSSWVIRINFTDCRISALPSDFNLDDVTEFLMPNADIASGNEILRALLLYSLQFETSKRIHLFFDGFDEIRNDQSEEIVLKLLQFLSSKTKATIWISTRNHLKRVLEESLSAFSISLEAISRERQREYLNRVWSSRLIFEVNGFNESKMSKLQQYVTKVLERAQKNFGTDIINFMGVPLQMAMIAETATPNPDMFDPLSELNVNSLFENVTKLYQLYVKMKLDIHFKKSGLCALQPEEYELLLRGCVKTHRNLGFNLFFPNHNHQLTVIKQMQCNAIGLVQITGSKVYDFIHLTLAEYFTADFFWNWFSKQNDDYQTHAVMRDRLLHEILLNARYKTVRMFLNDMIITNQSGDYDNVVQFHAEQLALMIEEHKETLLETESNTSLIVAVGEGNIKLIELLLNALKVLRTMKLTKYTLRKGKIGLIWNNARQEFLKEGYKTARAYVNFQQKNDSGMTALHFAAKGGYEYVCDLLLESKADINAADKSDMTALHFAAKGGYKGVCALLIENKSDVKAGDRFRRTALHFAAEQGSEEVCELLLKFKADVNALDKDGMTALHFAAKEGCKDVCALLLKYKADVNRRGRFRRTALHFAAEGGYEDVCELLLKNKADVEALDKDDAIALHFAAKRGDKRICALLLENKGGIHTRDRSKRTALHYAAERGFEDVCELLLNNKADINAIDKDNMTALHLAAKEGCQDVCALLLKNKAHVNRPGGLNRTALHFAAEGGYKYVSKFLKNNTEVEEIDKDGETAPHLSEDGGHMKVCALLLENEADINASDIFDMTPLHLAVDGGYTDVCSLLLEKKANVESVTRRGDTALHLAARGGYADICALLLENEANINSANDVGKTALHFAASGGYTIICRLLLKNSANLNAADKDGMTALHFAADGGYAGVCGLLLEREVDVNAANKDGMTALQFAERNRYKDVYALLLKNKVRVKTIGEDDTTALHCAAGNDYVDVFCDVTQKQYGRPRNRLYMRYTSYDT